MTTMQSHWEPHRVDKPTCPRACDAIGKLHPAPFLCSHKIQNQVHSLGFLLRNHLPEGLAQPESLWAVSSSVSPQLR